MSCLKLNKRLKRTNNYSRFKDRRAEKGVFADNTALTVQTGAGLVLNQY